MTPKEISQAAEIYLRYVRTRDRNLEVLFDQQADIVRNVDDALPYVCELVELSESDEEIAYIAAGPLEDMLNLYDEKVEKDLMVAARKSAKLQKAMRGVWASEGSKAREVLDRILKAYDLTYGSL